MDLNLQRSCSAIFHKEWSREIPGVFYVLFSFFWPLVMDNCIWHPRVDIFVSPTHYQHELLHVALSPHQSLVFSGKFSSIYFSSHFYVTFGVVILYFNTTFYQYNCCSHSEGVVLWQQYISCSLANE